MKRALGFSKFVATGIVLALSVGAVVLLWDHYMRSPWTRDGQVRVQVANIAPQVGGQIVDVKVRDNEPVRRGDLLYVIDQADYRIAVQLAEADTASKLADMQVKKSEDGRRRQLTTLSTSLEEKERFAGDSQVAQSAYQAALANLDKAKLNLQRTEVRSTVNGYVTNLLLRVGDYANVGVTNIAIVDSDSFWVMGYFEETKLASFRPGDPARVDLMGFRDPIRGHVESVARGISTPNATASTQGLPSVDAVYTWVRLAQRLPVRIKIDDVPKDVVLAAGLTATVTVVPGRPKPRTPISSASQYLTALLSFQKS